MAPLVTIAIPTYNRSATVGRAIDSALAQTHERLEVLVGDDASTDETGELLGELAERDPRVRIVRRVDRLGELTQQLTGLEHGRHAARRRGRLRDAARRR